MGSAGNFWPSLGMGFHDFAGSTVVHTIGGFIALAGAIEIPIFKFGRGFIEAVNEIQRRSEMSMLTGSHSHPPLRSVGLGSYFPAIVPSRIKRGSRGRARQLY